MSPKQGKHKFIGGLITEAYKSKDDLIWSVDLKLTKG